MRQKTEVEMRRAALVKIIRAEERLRASLAADRALNDRLPDTLAEFDAAVARGELRGVETVLDVLEGR